MPEAKFSPASRWRVELARDIATWYAHLPGVRMIVLGGSAARNLADDFSDLDILVFRDEIDAAELETPPLDSALGNRFTFHPVVPGAALLEQYTIGPAKADVAHLTMRWWDEQVSNVVDRFEISPETQDMLAGFMDSIVLYGEEEHGRWRQRISQYPHELARKMVEQHLMFYPPWVMQRHCLDRGDIVSFYDYLLGALRNIVGVLAGLNGHYVCTSKLKRVDFVLARMPTLPMGGAQHILRLMTMPREQVPGSIAEIAADLFNLVARRMPEVDLTRARWMAGWDMQPATAKPSFRAQTTH